MEHGTGRAGRTDQGSVSRQIVSAPITEFPNFEHLEADARKADQVVSNPKRPKPIVPSGLRLPQVRRATARVSGLGRGRGAALPDLRARLRSGGPAPGRYSGVIHATRQRSGVFRHLDMEKICPIMHRTSRTQRTGDWSRETRHFPRFAAMKKKARIASEDRCSIQLSHLIAVDEQTYGLGYEGVSCRPCSR